MVTLPAEPLVMVSVRLLLLPTTTVPKFKLVLVAQTELLLAEDPPLERPWQPAMAPMASSRKVTAM